MQPATSNRRETSVDIDPVSSQQAELKRWLEHGAEDPELVQELQQLSRQQDTEALREHFGSELEFGTGGLRGILGAGRNRMNIYTVRRATQGLAAYLLQKKDSRPVAIAYDSRKNSERFAQEAACVLAGNGIPVRLYPRLMPTPCLSFAVRHLGCAAGIVITASHNPATYNGYKVYGDDGCQITPDMAKQIYANMQKTDYFAGIARVDFEQGLAERAIQYIDESTVDAYMQAVKAQALADAQTGDVPLHVVYTPLNGTGRECVTRILQESGVRVTPVPEQMEPDGRFPTCPVPNPEEDAALERALALCEVHHPDLLLGTDPDCDRVGVFALHNGAYVRLSGNEVGVLLFDYICRRRCALGTMPARPVAVKTVVTTDMAYKIAEKYGVELRDTLTGFKYIGEQIGLLEQQGEAERFLFGFEESCGYLSGGYVRDKDAVVASMLVCEMARYYKARGLTLYDAMEALYREHGYYHNRLLSVTYPGLEGIARRTERMQHLREAPPAELAGEKIVRITDYRTGVRSTTGEALPRTDMLLLETADGSKVYIRPSGTEPKIKAYCFNTGTSRALATQCSDRLCAAVREQIGA